MKVTRQQCSEAMQCLIDNGIDEEEAPVVLQALGYILLDKELEEVIDWDFRAKGD